MKWPSSANTSALSSASGSPARENARRARVSIGEPLPAWSSGPASRSLRRPRPPTPSEASTMGASRSASRVAKASPAMTRSSVVRPDSAARSTQVATGLVTARPRSVSGSRVDRPRCPTTPARRRGVPSRMTWSGSSSCQPVGSGSLHSRAAVRCEKANGPWSARATTRACWSTDCARTGARRPQLGRCRSPASRRACLTLAARASARVNARPRSSFGSGGSGRGMRLMVATLAGRAATLSTGRAAPPCRMRPGVARSLGPRASVARNGPKSQTSGRTCDGVVRRAGDGTAYGSAGSFALSRGECQ